MSEIETDEAENPKRSGSLGKVVLWLVVIVVAIGGGLATPFVVGELISASNSSKTPQQLPKPDPEEPSEFIEFGEVTVNLDEARFSRYLRLNFSLQVAKSQKLEIEEKVKSQKIVFENWIQVHLADKTTEDLVGKFGRNRVRREMLDFFNKSLFDDGIERIQDVLFKEFHIQ
jgi:flagellar basal body-associated protein FliL